LYDPGYKNSVMDVENYYREINDINLMSLGLKDERQQLSEMLEYTVVNKYGNDRKSY